MDTVQHAIVRMDTVLSQTSSEFQYKKLYLSDVAKTKLTRHQLVSSQYQLVSKLIYFCLLNMRKGNHAQTTSILLKIIF
jgi:hypothetical protein